jgi:hypothetical protein
MKGFVNYHENTVIINLLRKYVKHQDCVFKGSGLKFAWDVGIHKFLLHWRKIIPLKTTDMKSQCYGRYIKFQFIFFILGF